MAEERNVSLQRASDSYAEDDESSTKEELQRRMEEARESITQTVSEIKETVANQYQNVVEALDWREQFRRRPVAFSAGAMGVGLLAGYGLASMVVGSRSSADYDDDDYASDEGEVVRHAYAALPPAVSAAGASGYAPPPARKAMDVGPDSRSTSYNLMAQDTGVSTSATEAASDDESDKPGLIDRFKETRAYDRLQSEVSTLGDRVLDELSQTAKNVVLPALLSKVKEMIGIDLLAKDPGASARSGANQTGNAGGASNAGAGSSTARTGEPSAQASSASNPATPGGASQSARAGGSSSASYATSENRGYGSNS